MNTRTTVDRFLVTASNIYKKVEPLLDAKEKITGGLDAFSRATRTLSTGELSANDEHIEKARVRVKQLAASLASLAKRDENDWIEKSGANILQKRETRTSIAWLQQRLADFSALERMVEGQRPLVQSLKSVLEHPVGMGARTMLEPTSLHGLDVIALGEIEGTLNRCSADLKEIKRRTQNALNELSRWR